MAQEDAGIQAVSNRRQLMNQSVCHDPEAGYSRHCASDSEYNETPGKTVRAIPFREDATTLKPWNQQARAARYMNNSSKKANK
ncbi:hypothetical protein T02_10635 [Trichinella nativa]|uniref:Uncharacterized protein n=1 Tax=Trichinella nativa TaxID=6335 RepID=A0A0V1L6J5_9BILA|nr:hypothetical protein T02_10635 [Trichinella nativa]